MRTQLIWPQFPFLNWGQADCIWYMHKHVQQIQAPTKQPGLKQAHMQGRFPPSPLPPHSLALKVHKRAALYSLYTAATIVNDIHNQCEHNHTLCSTNSRVVTLRKLYMLHSTPTNTRLMLWAMYNHTACSWRTCIMLFAQKSLHESAISHYL